jgi:phage terminase large subunit-like protein
MGREGWIKTTPGEVIDYEFIRREINELSKIYKIVEIPYDKHNATQLATELGEQDGFTMVEHKQGFISMSEPSKDFSRRDRGEEDTGTAGTRSRVDGRNAS